MGTGVGVGIGVGVGVGAGDGAGGLDGVSGWVTDELGLSGDTREGSLDSEHEETTTIKVKAIAIRPVRDIRDL